MAEDDAARGFRAREVAAGAGHDQGDAAEPANDHAADVRPIGGIEPASTCSAPAKHVRRTRNQLQIAEDREHGVNVRFSPAEVAALEAATAITGQSVSLLLATAAEEQAYADLADPDAAVAHAGPQRRPPAEAKRTAVPEALFTAEGKQHVLNAAALTGRKTAWYVADAGLRAAAHILRTHPDTPSVADESTHPVSESGHHNGHVRPDKVGATAEGVRSVPGPWCPAPQTAADIARDAVVFAHVASSVGSGTDRRHAIVRAFEDLSVQLRRIGVNLNQVARAVNATGTAEHADHVLDQVDAAAMTAHDLLLELLDQSRVCTACGHRDAPRRRRRAAPGKEAAA